MWNFGGMIMTGKYRRLRRNASSIVILSVTSYKVAPGVEAKLTTCEGRNLLVFLNFSENHSRLTPSTVYFRIRLLTVILIGLPDS